MEPDLDDTRRAALRPSVPPHTPDVDDTVRHGSAAAPPALVEPPAPAPRALPVVAEPLEFEGPVAAEAPADGQESVAVLRAGFADGTEVPIDAPVYVGRRPSRPRIRTGPEPRLVALPSPARELSATHLELRTVGSAVVASDMRSTNGTVVQLPGAAPRTLIRGESAVVIPGTRIDLGEGAVIDILPPLATEGS